MTERKIAAYLDENPRADDPANHDRLLRAVGVHEKHRRCLVVYRVVCKIYGPPAPTRRPSSTRSDPVDDI